MLEKEARSSAGNRASAKRVKQPRSGHAGGEEGKASDYGEAVCFV